MSDDAATVRHAVHDMASRRPETPGVLNLVLGGELAITEHDGDYQFRIDMDGGHFAVRLTILDLWRLRSLVADLVLARTNEVES
jgi:hypothetical protein